MSVVLITGSNGLIGAEAAKFYLNKKFTVIGIDNNRRLFFFGKDASTKPTLKELNKYKNYYHYSIDIRSNLLEKIFHKFKKDICLIVHCAAQPSHDWAKNNLFEDFEINSLGTIKLLNYTLKYSPEAVFIHLSTNKVYGDKINEFKFIKLKKRYSPKSSHLKNGINENFPIDNSVHSFFGASKLSSDIYAQEFGKNYGLKTNILRGGCLTGPLHRGAELHGFLSYLVKCNIKKKRYKIYGHNGFQVRDNIHSYDLVRLFDLIFKKPTKGEVFNVGGGKQNNCSILEAIEITERLSKIKMNFTFEKKQRVGDHKWWISDLSKLKKNYPTWIQSYNLEDTIKEIIDFNI